MKQILENEHLPPPKEQADNLILCFGKGLPGPGEYVTESSVAYQSIMGAKNEKGARFVLEHLLKEGFVDRQLDSRVTLTFKGWDRYDELQRTISDTRKAFMAMKFKDDKLDRFFRECLKPAVEKTGFDLRRLDEDPQAGSIDNRLRVEIRTSRFLIADLTHNNLGAYWEAGFAEGLGKPVFYTCEKNFFDKNKGTHFDTRQHFTVIWEEGKFDEAAKEIKTAIRATLPADAKMEDD
ncbi:MAG: hypothetical protein ABIH23_01505 [bacterium]